MRYFFEISYKGTSYSGWQTQPNAISVQQVIEEKMQVIWREHIPIVASGRTDTGVHAIQQFAHFDMPQAIKEYEIRSLNKLLPPDIAILDYKMVKDDASARFDAITRGYVYKIIQHKNPFCQDQAFLFTRLLDIRAMNEAAKLLLLHNDFQCFSKVHTDVSHFRCQIIEAKWHDTLEGCTFEIRANRFLRGMVRAIVGTLIEVGLGRMSSAQFEQIILSKDRKKAGQAAPPEGLYLHKVQYPNEIFI
jgi:tRNA pseudouridine38-40 synthase